MDEMWSFVHDKSQQYWLWWAVEHRTGVPLAYCFGTREHKHLDELRILLAPFHIHKIYADNNYAYKKHITESTVVTGKRARQKILCKRRQGVVKETGANQRISRVGHNPA